MGTVELDIYRHVIVNHKHQNAEESSNFASISSLLNAAKGASEQGQRLRSIDPCKRCQEFAALVYISADKFL